MFRVRLTTQQPERDQVEINIKIAIAIPITIVSPWAPWATWAPWAPWTSSTVNRVNCELSTVKVLWVECHLLWFFSLFATFVQFCELFFFNWTLVNWAKRKFSQCIYFLHSLCVTAAKWRRNARAARRQRRRPRSSDANPRRLQPHRPQGEREREQEQELWKPPIWPCTVNPRWNALPRSTRSGNGNGNGSGSADRGSVISARPPTAAATAAAWAALAVCPPRRRAPPQLAPARPQRQRGRCAHRRHRRSNNSSGRGSGSGSGSVRRRSSARPAPQCQQRRQQVAPTWRPRSSCASPRARRHSVASPGCTAWAAWWCLRRQPWQPQRQLPSCPGHPSCCHPGVMPCSRPPSIRRHCATRCQGKHSSINSQLQGFFRDKR